MKAKKFELFGGCLGNGITLCNKAVTENGDYKQIGHISEGGHIKLYVDPGYIPGDAMATIEKWAADNRAKFFSKYGTLSYLERYEFLLNLAPLSLYLDCIKDKKTELEEKTRFMYQQLFSLHLI